MSKKMSNFESGVFSLKINCLLYFQNVKKRKYLKAKEFGISILALLFIIERKLKKQAILTWKTSFSKRDISF